MQDPVNWQFPRPRETKTLFVRVRGCGEAMVTQGRLCKARLGITFACSFLHLSFAMLLILCLLQQPLIGAKPLHGYLALQANFEHYLELSYHSIIIHLGRPPPKCSMPAEAGGKQLD